MVASCAHLIHGLALLHPPVETHGPPGTSLIMFPVVCCGVTTGMGALAHSLDADCPSRPLLLSTEPKEKQGGTGHLGSSLASDARPS